MITNNETFEPTFGLVEIRRIYTIKFRNTPKNRELAEDFLRNHFAEIHKIFELPTNLNCRIIVYKVSKVTDEILSELSQILDC